MYSIFEDEDDIFMGSPRSKYYDTIYNASSELVKKELTRQIERQAAMEHFLEKHMGEHFSEEIDRFIHLNEDELKNKINGLYVECMGNIISQNE